MSIDASHLTYIPFDEATCPRDGEVVCDRWWVVHPDKGLAVFGRGSLQCNISKSLPERLAVSYAGHEVRFIPVAFVGYISGRY
jgi:hypothetical protein